MHHIATTNAPTPATLASVADATRFTPRATGSPRRSLVAVQASSPPPNSANTAPTKIASPLSTVQSFRPSHQGRDADRPRQRTHEPPVNTGRPTPHEPLRPRH